MDIGYIGTGNMGRPMAMNLLKAGHKLTVCDKRKETAEELVKQGAILANTPGEVAKASQITFSSLPGPQQVEEVALGENGVLQGAAGGSYYIDMSTSTPSLIRKIASAGAEKGVQVLDAPVSGGVRKSTAGTLTIMVGGNRAAFEFCEPILRIMGENVTLVGEVGSGSVVKLVNNMMAMTNILTAIEGLIVGVKAGMDLKTLFEVIDASSGGSFILKGNFPNRIFSGKFDPPSFALSLAVKDVRLGTDFARELGVPLKVNQLACDLLTEAMQGGLGNKDIGAYATLLEKATGVELRDPNI
ncbi:NAD(P)-dependent oxidoreductase [Chloroflexota bacterium]